MKDKESTGWSHSSHHILCNQNDTLSVWDHCSIRSFNPALLLYLLSSNEKLKIACNSQLYIQHNFPGLIKIAISKPCLIQAIKSESKAKIRGKKEEEGWVKIFIFKKLSWWFIITLKLKNNFISSTQIVIFFRGWKSLEILFIFLCSSLKFSILQYALKFAYSLITWIYMSLNTRT